VDLKTANVRYCIYKRVLSKSRLDRMRSYLLSGEGLSLHATYFGSPQRNYFKMSIERSLQKSEEEKERFQVEPFRLLHRSPMKEEI